MMSRRSLKSSAGRWLLASCTVAALADCSGSKAPPPSPLQANPATVQTGVAWTQKLPAEVNFPLQVATVGNEVVVADSRGNVQAMQANSGAMLWQASVGKGISAGVGSDGTTAAVVTDRNELVALRAGKEQWRIPLDTRVYTAPLVAGGRVFVLGADRSVSAYDGGNGFRLWTQKARAADDGLVLRQGSLLTAAGGALLAGVSGRVVAFNPDNGTPLLQLNVASARGGTDVARMGDVLAPASREGGSLCTRTFQAGVSCASLAGGNTLWSQPSTGSTGISGDAQIVVGSDDSGNVVAWERASGNPAWANSTLRYRGLSAPLVAGNAVLVGDAQGYVHVLARQNGALANRVATDGAPIRVAPVLAGSSVIVVGSKGTVTAIQAR